MTPRTAGLTGLTLVAFAANSWLCRAALVSDSIDPASFTAIRLGTGAAVLAALAWRGRDAETRAAGSYRSAAALFGYALLFSLAYLELDAGMGAMLLFGAVQATMLLGGLADGHRPSWGEGAGLAIALAGLVWLTAPGRTAPPPLAAGGMALAGVAWGIYSLHGRGARRPLAANAGNFARTLPGALAAVAVAVAMGAGHAGGRGLALAAISGGVTSGLGYALWYAALPGLSPVQAGVVQLAVPVLAAAGGVALLGERIGGRLVGAGALVLGGIALAVISRRR